MVNIGIFDGTNFNYIINYLREVFKINIVNDFKLYNAFSTKNIANHYDIVLFISEVTDQNYNKAKHVISKARVLIINGDDKRMLNLIDELKLENVYILTYGFNSKSTITVSSIDELENTVMCMLQRDIVDIYDNVIAPKEINISKGNSTFNNYKLLGIVTLMMILGYIK